MWRYLHHKSDRDKAGGDNYFVLLREVLTKSSQWITRIELCNKHDRYCVFTDQIMRISLWFKINSRLAIIYNKAKSTGRTLSIFF